MSEQRAPKQQALIASELASELASDGSLHSSDDLESSQPVGQPSQRALLAAVDALAFPMMALQADGVLLHANLAAQDVLTDGQAFMLSAHGQVQPALATRRAEFATALQAAAAGQKQQLVWANGANTVYAALRQLGLPAQGVGAPQLLLMMAPPADAVFDASGFATTHRLSAAETRVLEALLHGDHAQATANRLGVGVATVRSQIAAIRKKTGHDGVSSLLAALGDLPPLRRAAKPGAQPPTEGREQAGREQAGREQTESKTARRQSSPGNPSLGE